MKRSPGQIALLQAVRIQDNEEMGALVERADISDLEWFALMLDLQLEETPHWVKDEKQLHDIQTWHRRVRTLVTGVLHNKRVEASKRKTRSRIVRDAAFVIVGALIAAITGWALTWYFPSSLD